MNVGSLFVALGFDVDDKKLKEFQGEVTQLRNNLFKVAGVAAGAVYGVNRFVSGSANEAVRLQNLAEQTGFAADEVQRLYNVAGRLNTEITLDDTINAFRSLSDSIAEMTMGEGAIGIAGQLGILINNDTDPLDVINQLRANFQKNVQSWGYARTVNMMEQLGLGREFVESIKATESEFNRLANNPILTGSQIGTLQKYADAVKELAFQWRITKADLSTRISVPLVETLKEIPNIAKDWSESFSSIRDVLAPVIQYMSQNTSVVYAFAAAIGVLAAALAPITTVLVAFTAALKDIGDYRAGKDSLLGDIVSWFTENVYDPNRWIKERMRKGEPVPEQALARSGLDPLGRYTNYTEKNVESLMSKDVARNNNQTSFNKNTTNNNTLNIQSSADTEELAREVIEGLQELEAKSDLDNFPRGSVQGLY